MYRVIIRNFNLPSWKLTWNTFFSWSSCSDWQWHRCRSFKQVVNHDMIIVRMTETFITSVVDSCSYVDNSHYSMLRDLLVIAMGLIIRVSNATVNYDGLTMIYWLTAVIVNFIEFSIQQFKHVVFFNTMNLETIKRD